MSTFTIYEPPLSDDSAPVTTEVTLQSDANIDRLSLNSQTGFPLPCENPDTPLDSAISTPNESDDSNFKPTLQPNQSTDHTIPTSQESTGSSNTASTGTYIHNSPDTSPNNTPYRKAGRDLETSHFSISEFLDTVGSELFNKECIEPGRNQLDTIYEDKNCDTDIRQWQMHSKKDTAHKSFKTSEGSGIHDYDDELLTSLAERYGECSQTTSGSSGYSSGSYVDNLNGCSTDC